MATSHLPRRLQRLVPPPRPAGIHRHRLHKDLVQSCISKLIHFIRSLVVYELFCVSSPSSSPSSLGSSSSSSLISSSEL
ncbi:hypothetical protein M405DRAFT_862027 [Rhizopogon salebrosus TDB-379]|nr:hypothetical protein M405DRAFT_862027 [Rhizopogon salebrosus TDB-379]